MRRRITIVLMILMSICAIKYNSLQIYSKGKMTAENYFHDKELYAKYHLEAIDLSRPVILYPVKKGTTFIQYQIPGAKQGCFYGWEGATPDELGISSEGFNRITRTTVKKEKRTYIAVRDFTGLFSHAAPIKDNWSTPLVDESTKGGATQLFTACTSCFKLLRREL